MNVTIEIFRLIRAGSDFVLDPTEKVGDVRLVGDHAKVSCQNPLFENTLVRIFESDALLLRPTPRSVHDAVVRLAKGSPEWLENILAKELYASGLAGRIVIESGLGPISGKG